MGRRTKKLALLPGSDQARTHHPGGVYVVLEQSERYRLTFHQIPRDFITHFGMVPLGSTES